MPKRPAVRIAKVAGSGTADEAALILNSTSCERREEQAERDDDYQKVHVGPLTSRTVTYVIWKCRIPTYWAAEERN